MAKFCGKCGATLNENGFCPNCDSDRIETENANQKKKDQEQNNVDGSVSDNTYSKGLTKKEKKVREKVDKAAAKVKKKADRKISAIKTKAKNKSIGKTDEQAAKIEKKADKKADKLAIKYDRKAKKKADKVSKKAARPIRKKIGVFLLKLLATILVIGILFSTVLGALVYFGIADIPVVFDVMDAIGIKNNVSKSININEYMDYSNNNRTSEEEKIDSVTYYNKYSKVINEVSLEKSTDMMSEEEAYNLFQSYGFTECIIVSEYTETGECTEPNEIIPFSSNRHPVYRSDYVDEGGNIFEIYLIDGCIMTNPVSFNSKAEANIKVAVSSAKTLKSYDSKTKTFYETMPKNSIIRVQEASNSYIETLEKLVFEGETQ